MSLVSHTPDTRRKRGGGVSQSWAKGSTRRWRATRAFVLSRDGYRCLAHAEGWCALAPGEHECEGDGPRTVRHAHHTKGRAVTGDDPRFLIAACAACNYHCKDPSKYSPQPRRVSRW